MNESEIERQKYKLLMAKVEELEDRITDAEKDLAEMAGLAESDEARVLREEIKALGAELAERRAELARISDGCGRPRLG